MSAKKKRKIEEIEKEEKQKESPTQLNKSNMYTTISIALPGSIINNAQTLQLKTNLAGQIARTAAIFRVNEIIVFNEDPTTDSSREQNNSVKRTTAQDDPNTFLCRILQYMETPQYLRKSLFEVHPDLTFAGLLNPLDAPHHMREHEVTEFREGVVIEKSKENTSIVNCGLSKNVVINKGLDPGIRVTVQLKNPSKPRKHHYKGTAVSPSFPFTSSGIYWGYNVRYANSFGEVFTTSFYEEGYDLIIGTSERGDNIDQTSLSLTGQSSSIKHCLIVFGGQRGLEYSLEQDKSLKIKSIQSLFHYYLNTCPNQGSRTIRTEEALLISLSILRPQLVPL